MPGMTSSRPKAGNGELQDLDVVLQPQRRTFSLDGTWQIAEGKMDVVPTAFERTVPVPGLASLATPPFADPPGPKVVAAILVTVWKTSAARIPIDVSLVVFTLISLRMRPVRPANGGAATVGMRRRRRDSSPLTCPSPRTLPRNLPPTRFVRTRMRVNAVINTE